MDCISKLPDALLLKILYLLPAQDVVATMVLSKQWQFLWSLVPGLIYDDSYQDTEYESFSRFIHRYLLLHEAPVLENLHFKFSQKCGDVDIQVWLRAVLKRCVRKLIIEIESSSSINPPVLPRCLYTECRMLVTLKLENVILVDFSSSISFPSLKTLSLVSVVYPGDEFVNSLLSSCPVLEDLNVERCPNENVTIFTVRVPSLKRLNLLALETKDTHDEDGFVIEAPSLEYLDIVDDTDGFWVIENDIPNIVEANVDSCYSHHPGKILSSITSVKRLYLCLSTSEDLYPVHTVFHHLVDLTVCTCETEWLNLLMRVLGDSPNLRALTLDLCHDLRDEEPRPCWNEPSSVPKCLLSSLETLEWINYEGTEEEKELVGFILRNGSCLEKVTISSKCTDRDMKLEMIKELTLSIRRSPKCQLAFD